MPEIEDFTAPSCKFRAKMLTSRLPSRVFAIWPEHAKIRIQDVNVQNKNNIPGLLSHIQFHWVILWSTAYIKTISCL